MSTLSKSLLQEAIQISRYIYKCSFITAKRHPHRSRSQAYLSTNLIFPSLQHQNKLKAQIAMANSHSISLALSILAFTSHVGTGFAAPVATASSLSPLLGYSPSNTLVNENTSNIQYSLAPGQTADANIGAYLDFENIANPQPIRGTKGGTDPGPRKYTQISPFKQIATGRHVADMKHLGASEYDRINSDKLAPPVRTICLALKYYIDNSRERIMVTSRTRSGPWVCFHFQWHGCKF